MRGETGSTMYNNDGNDGKITVRKYCLFLKQNHYLEIATDYSGSDLN